MKEPWSDSPTIGGVHIALSSDDLFYIKECASVASWHGCIKGPIPLGNTEPIVFTFDLVVRPDAEQALAAMYHMIRAYCDASSYEFDLEDWEVLHLALRNSS